MDEFAQLINIKLLVYYFVAFVCATDSAIVTWKSPLPHFTQIEIHFVPCFIRRNGLDVCVCVSTFEERFVHEMHKMCKS